MKLLHVIPTIDPKAGGTTESLIRSAHIMHSRGIDLEVACLDAPDSFQEIAGQYPWVTHQLGPGTLGTYQYSKRAKQWMDQQVIRFNAVIVHGMWQYHGFVASNACRKHKVPYFVFSHGMLDPWFNRTYPLKKLKKLCYWFWGEHPVLKHAESMLFTCEEERILARQSFRPYQVTESVVGLGTEAPAETKAELTQAFKASAPEWGTEPFLLFMSRIQEKKGLDLLVKAYQQLRSKYSDLPNLVIAGPIQQPDYAERLKASAPQDGIHWVGSLSGVQKWRALAAADAMVLPSHQENFGIVVAEALAVGTPVLISDQVNIWREIQSEGAGLVASDDLTGTCQLLSQWLALDNSEKQQMSEIAIRTFQSHFDIRQATQRLLDLIDQTLRKS